MANDSDRNPYGTNLRRKSRAASWQAPPSPGTTAPLYSRYESSAANVYYSLLFARHRPVFQQRLILGGGGGNRSEPCPPFHRMVFTWIHLAILAGPRLLGLGKLLLLPPVFRRNADNISSAIPKATAAQ